MRAQASLTNIIAAIFKRTAQDVAQQIAEHLHGLKKADFWETIDLSLFDLLAKQAQKDLKEVARDSGKRTLAQLQITDHEITGVVNEASLEYGKDRAAEMVGKKWVNGELVDNPNAEWVITDSTREELRGLVEDVMAGDLEMTDLRQEIMNSAAFSRSRAEMIARTEIMAANAQGALESFEAAKEAGVNIKKEWLADAQACEICQQNQDAGPIDIDEEFPSGDMAPPLHPNCFLAGTPISAFGVSKCYKRWFEGEIIVIGISGNHEISVTPNHPILTRKGWIPASIIELSDDLAQCLHAGELASCYPNTNYVEAMIEDVPRSLSMAMGVTTKRMKVSSEDFHGDGGDGAINKKVDIVWAASDLPLDGAESSEATKESDLLGFTHLGGPLLASRSSLAQFVKGNFSSSYGIMGRLRSFLSHFRRCSRCLHFSGLAMSSYFKTKASKTGPNATAMNADASCNIDAALSRNISFVKIEYLRRRKFSGHVYNLQTVDGWYIAGGLIASNCECVLVPVVEYDDEGD